jgi:tRNA(adenine34) deaminase
MKRLVFGAFDEKAGAVGSVFDVIRGPRTFNNIEIVNRIMSKECSEILKDFFVKKRV